MREVEGMDPKKKGRGIDDESLLRLAAVAIHEQLAEEETMGCGEVVLSQQEIQEQWDAVMKKYRRRKFEKALKGCFRKAAAAAAVVLLVSGGSLATVMAASPTIRQMILADFGEYSKLQMLFSSNSVEIPEDWEEKYSPTYIPEGFTYKETKSISTIKTLVYVNNEECNLGFSVIAPNANISIDTENMDKSEVKINGCDAILYEKRNRIISSILINYGDCVIYISGPVQADEIIKIAESITEK